jgi:hypothetical protein
MKKIISHVLILTVFVSTTGCSAFRSSTETVTVTTDQSDTQIYINGSLVGKGTAQANVKRNRNVAIMAKKAGYITAQRTIGRGLNTTGILDIIGGVIILLPLFGLLAAGAYSLDETNISIVMVKE